MLSFFSIRNSGLLKVNNPKQGEKYAIYLIRNNIVEKKIWYQSDNFFYFKDIDNFLDYKMNFFILDKDNNKKIHTLNFSEISSSKPIDYINYFSRDYSFDSIKTFVDFFLTDKFFFNSLMSVKHGSNKVSKNFLSDVCNVLNSHLHSSEFLLYSNEIQNAILNTLTYLCEDAEILKNVLKLLDAYKDDEVLFNYLSGIIYCKLGEPSSSVNFFKKLIEHKNDLEYHQAASIAYNFDYETSDNEDQFIIESENILNKCTNENGIVLMSCDYGYYKSYAIKTLKKCSEFQLNCHLHLVLKYNSMLADIDISWFKENNIGLSYEIEPNYGNKVTYYSIARYIVLRDIIELYNSSVIVSDVDINFETNYNYLFDNISPEKIGLIFNHNQNLPWLQILAGFNFFGRNTCNSHFVKYLKSFLLSSYSSGKDPWMLDQVALKVTEQKTIEDNIIFNLKDEMLSGFRQYDNRAKSRREAREAIEKFDN